MSKKEPTNPAVKELFEQSDIDLIEALNQSTYSDAKTNTIMAILDYRLKKVINHLKEVTEENVRSTGQFNKKLVNLTWVLVILTLILLVFGFMQIYLSQ